ncbi:MAG: YciI family protein [Candidatus Zixiibacteriota bacterium]
MQFIVIAYDGTDEKALERRLTVREAHLKSAKEMVDSGKWVYAAGILSDDGKMIGSMIICDFPSRDQLEQEWLKEEPYVTGKVWKTVNVNRAQVAAFCANK